MNYLKLLVKVIGYSVLILLGLVQVLAIASAPTLKESLWRILLLLVVCLFFAIKWQRRNKPTDQQSID
jgi:glucan phosphoethanolaminetransferase (alkaline phosphatase superfamily)